MEGNDELYAQFWVWLAYFFSLVFFVDGYMNGYQNYIYYAFFFFIIGLGMLISFRLNKVLDILAEDEDFTFYEDSD